MVYYQKGRSLDDYIDEFQDLVTDSGYTDPKMIVVKFHRGLNPQIQNAVTTMVSGRLSDMNPTKWYEMARTVDKNRATNEAFQSAYQSPAAVVSRSASILPARVTLSLPNAHLVPTPGNPVPMDIDLAWRKAIPSALCFYCGQPGHFSKNCLDRFDVQNLSTDELQELLEDRLAKLDVAAPDSGLVVPANQESDRGFFQRRRVKSMSSLSVYN